MNVAVDETSEKQGLLWSSKKNGNVVVKKRDEHFMMPRSTRGLLYGLLSLLPHYCVGKPWSISLIA